MYWRLLQFALCGSAFLLTTCAKADDSGIDPGSQSQDPCDRVCSKAAKVGCKPCTDAATAYCHDMLQSACAAEEKLWIDCILNNPDVRCSDTAGFSACNTESDAIDTCLNQKKDTCATANNRVCEEPSPCLSGTDTTDCAPPP